MKKFLQSFPFYAALFPLYSALFLWQVNVDQIPPTAVTPTLLLALGVGLGIFLVCWLIVRRLRPAGLVSLVFAALFSLYGHLHSALKGMDGLALAFSRHRSLLLALGLLALLAIILILRNKKDLFTATLFFNLAVSAGLLFSAAQIGLYWLGRPADPRAQPAGETTAPVAANPDAPDVYYIILDSYSRQDYLLSRYAFDNSQFLTELEALGFTVARCSQSNYTETYLSISSSLNMNYADALGVTLDRAGQENLNPFFSLIHDSQVRASFERLGYQFVTFKTIYGFINFTDSDINYDLEVSTSYANKTEAVNFRFLWLQTTFMKLPIEWMQANPELLADLPPSLVKLLNPFTAALKSRIAQTYEQHLYALDRLAALPSVAGPKFVYAHLVTTHQPFVFRPDGSMVWPVDENVDNYIDQILYTNQRMLEILKGLIEDSPVPPIIIVQGDHGYGRTPEKVKILNAYYLPEGGNQQIYPHISPVNTFRVIFNQYFGESYPLLPDISRFSPLNTPYAFQEVPNTCVP